MPSSPSRRVNSILGHLLFVRVEVGLVAILPAVIGAKNPLSSWREKLLVPAACIIGIGELFKQNL
jgi:hypothetical protein